MQQIPLFLWTGIFLVFPAFAEEPTVLAVGEQNSIAVPFATKFSVGNSEVIQVKNMRAGNGEALLLVKAKSQGYSDLVLFSDGSSRKRLEFRVVAKRQQAVVADHGAHFQSSRLKLAPQGQGWLAKGNTTFLDDWNAIKLLEKPAAGVHSLARLHPFARVRAEQKIRRRLGQAGLFRIEVSGAGNTILLRGEAASQLDKAFAEQIAREVFLGCVSHIRVPFEEGKSVRIHARILELMHSAASSLGLDWTKEVPSVLQVGKLFTRADFRIEALLNMLEKNGQANLLSQPQILLNEAGTAELKVGGEFPVRLKSRYSESVQWKQYGLLLRIEVPGISRKKARAKIVVEISGIDPNTSQDGIPGIRSSHMETSADLELGKPVLLSGLMEKRRQETTSAIAGLGDIPLLGALFRSKDFQENRSELVILLEAVARE